MPKEDIEDILESAIRAPSGDNCQPWRFRVKGNIIELFNQPEADDTPYNFHQLGSMVSHGAVIEYIKIKASALGYRSEVILFPSIEDQNFTARITLTKDRNITPDSLSSFLSLRGTNRKLFKTDSLSPEETGTLTSAGDSSFKLIMDRVKIKSLVKAASANEIILFRNKKTHYHFFKILRWSEKEAAEHPDGFFIKTLELKPPEEKAMRLISYWPIAKVLSFLGVNKKIAATNTETFSHCGAIGLITAVNYDKLSYIQVGRVLARVWLTATKLGLALHPLAGLLFFAHRVLIDHDDTLLNQKEKEIALQSHKEIQELSDIKDRPIAMMFRLGHPNDPPSAISARYDLDHYLIQDD